MAIATIWLTVAAMLAGAPGQSMSAPPVDENHYACTLTRTGTYGSIRIDWGIDVTDPRTRYMLSADIRRGDVQLHVIWFAEDPRLAMEPGSSGTLLVDGLRKGRNRLELWRAGVSHSVGLTASYRGDWSDRSGTASLFGSLDEWRALMTGVEGLNVVSLREKDYWSDVRGMLTPAMLDAPADMARTAVPEVARITAGHVRLCPINNEKDIVI